MTYLCTVNRRDQDDYNSWVSGTVGEAQSAASAYVHFTDTRSRVRIFDGNDLIETFTGEHYAPVPMIVFQPQARDSYAVAVFEGNRKMTGGIFASRAEAEAYAAAFYGGNYTVTGTCPSYDRTYLAGCPDCQNPYTGPYHLQCQCDVI
jgi:hypothetical protein